jgi:hypothetical protein
VLRTERFESSYHTVIWSVLCDCHVLVVADLAVPDSLAVINGIMSLIVSVIDDRE